MDLEKKLYKSSKNKIIGGVCGLIFGFSIRGRRR